jgi:hypothetical protein
MKLPRDVSGAQLVKSLVKLGSAGDPADTNRQQTEP